MKSFSTVRDTQRGSQLHGEEKREDGDRGDQEEKRGIKRGESNLASNHFPKKGVCQGCLLSPSLSQHTFGEGTGGTPTNPLKSRDRRQRGWRKSPEPEEGALQWNKV